MTSRSPTKVPSRPSSRASTAASPKSPPKKKQFTEEERAEIEELKLLGKLVLLKRKTKAIEALDFDLSGRIAQALLEQNSDNTQTVIQNQSTGLLYTLRQAISDYENNIQDIEEAALDREIKIRQETEVVIKRLQEKTHLDQNVDLHVKYQLELLRNEKRKSAEVIHLEQQAMASARGDDVETANLYKKQSIELHEKQLDERKQKIDLKYQKLMNQLEEKQLRDFEILSTKLELLLQQANQFTKKEIEEQRTLIFVYIKHVLTSTVRESYRELKPSTKAREKQVETALTKLVLELLNEKGLDFVIDQLKGFSKTNENN